MVVFLGIRPGQVPEEPQPEGLDPFYVARPNTCLFLYRQLRDVRELLSLFPIPPIPTRSFPFPFALLPVG